MSEVKYILVGLYTKKEILAKYFKESLFDIHEFIDLDKVTAEQIVKEINSSSQEDKRKLEKALQELNNLRSKNQLSAMIEAFYDKSSVDIVVGSPEFNKNGLHTFEYDFLVEVKQDGHTNYILNFHPHLHFFRLVLLLKPSIFIMNTPQNYFETVEGEFLTDFFKEFGYKVQLYTFPKEEMGVLVGTNLNVHFKIENIDILSTNIIYKEFALWCKKVLDALYGN